MIRRRKYQSTIGRAIRRAQAISQHQGFHVGQVVATSDDTKAYSLLKIIGGKAIIGYGNIQKEVQVSDLFDPNIAKAEAFRIQREEEN